MSTSEAAFPNRQQTFSTPPLSVVLAIILLIFFITCFFSLFFCRCLLKSLMQAWNRQRNASRNVGNSGNDPAVNPGLDPKTIESFPSFPYSYVKEYQKYGLECAICISEFSDDDILRILTTCCHAFHQDCVDLWLQSHKTCPVCRRVPEPDQTSLEKFPILLGGSHDRSISHDSLQDEVSVVIRENDPTDETQNKTESSSASTNQANENREEQNSVLNRIFSRSHSTGRSLVRDKQKDEEDKYRLRLPEHMKLEITRCHNHTKSCITFGEFTSPQASNGSFLGETSVGASKDINKA